MLNICKQILVNMMLLLKLTNQNLLYIRILRQGVSVNNINIKFQGKEIPAESGGVHLGFMIFFLTFSQSSVKYHSFKTFCMPLYGSFET